MLTEAMNTYNIALYAIKEKGYKIKLELDETEEEIISWIATKETITISAFNPLSLLALAVVIEQYGMEWKQIETGNLYDEILEEKIKELHTVIEKSQENMMGKFEKYVEDNKYERELDTLKQLCQKIMDLYQINKKKCAVNTLL